MENSRLLGEELRANLPALGRLVTIETGKILSEGYGEVQEMIDICGFGAPQPKSIDEIVFSRWNVPANLKDASSDADRGSVRSLPRTHLAIVDQPQQDWRFAYDEKSR